MAGNTQITIEVLLKDLFSKELPVINTGIDKIKTSIANLGTTLSPVINKFTALAGAAIGLKVVSESLDLAQQQVDAESRLLQALSGRVKALEQVKNLAKEIQRETILNDREILNMATNILNAGAKVEDLEVKLRAAVETAAAFKFQPLDAAGGIGFLESDALGERFSRRVAQLQKLAHEGRLAADGAKLLEERFRGAAAALADTSFGRVEQTLNRIQDFFEEIGVVFNEIRGQFLLLIEPLLKRVTDFVKSKEVSVFISVVKDSLKSLEGSVGVLIKGFTTLIGLFIVIKTGSIFLGIIKDVSLLIFAVGRLVFPITTILLAVGAGGLLFAALTGQVDDLSKSLANGLISLQRSTGEFRHIFNEVKEGRLQIADLFLFIEIKFKLLNLKFQEFIAQPFFNFIDKTKINFAGLFDILEAEFKLFFEKRVKRTVEGSLEFIKDPLIKLFSEFSGIPESAFSDVTFISPSKIAELEDNLKRVRDNVQNASLEVEKESAKTLIRLQAGILQLQKDFNNELDTATEQVIQRRVIETAGVLSDLNLTYRRILSNTIDLAQQIAREEATIFSIENVGSIIEGNAIDVFDKVNEAAVDPIKQLVRGTLLEQLRAQEISYAKFYKERIDLERAFTDFKKGQIDLQVADIEKLMVVDEERLVTLNSLQEDSTNKILALQEKIGLQSDKIFNIDERRGTAILNIQSLQQKLNTDVVESSREYNNIIKEFKKEQEKLIDLDRLKEKTQGNINELTAELDILQLLQKDNLEDILESQGSIQDKSEKILALEQKRLKFTQDAVDAETALVEARKTISDLVEAKLNKAFEIFQQQKGVIDKLVGEGFISSEEGVERLTTAYDIFNATLVSLEDQIFVLKEQFPEFNFIFDELITKLERLDLISLETKNSEALGFFEGIDKGFTSVQNQLGTLGKLGTAIGTELANSFNGLIDAFSKGEIHGREFIRELSRRVAVLIVQALFLRALFASLGLVSTAATGLYNLVVPAQAQNKGGQIVSKSSNPVYITYDPNLDSTIIKRSVGGKIPGPEHSPDRDSRLVYATIGEWMIRRKAAKYYQDYGMDAINNMLVPREIIHSYARGAKSAVNTSTISMNRNTGGPVNSGPVVSQRQQGYIVASDDSVETLMSGGIGGFLRVIGRHSRDIKQYLGIT